MKFNVLMVSIGVSMLIACNGKSKQKDTPSSEKENTPPVEVLEFEKIKVPANAGESMKWELQKEASDDFNYTHKPVNQKTDFGNGKWYNFYHNAWNGPGSTYWQYDHVEVDGSHLIIKSSRNPSTEKMGVPGVNAGCITGNKKVKYPVFVEASVSVANIALASDVWLLSPDDTQEIDIIECYGGKEPNNSYFSQFIHLSHHSFIREPFTDYQPRDIKSWWKKDGVTSWGEYSWNNGNRKYTRIAVNWISPNHFEYYIDGELVRVLYNKAMANKINGKWDYDYPSMTDGKLDMDGGYQKLNNLKSNDTYSFEMLKEASLQSKVDVIDPYNFQKGTGFNKEMDIIINMESQNWHVLDKRTPSDEDLADPNKNTMKVDWIRVYKPIKK
ncbi:LamG domain-containing protein [Aquimarina agarilytica]|uniref:beta-agarase n=1 Tax=Aquimarina agarilytica TaxID=1087449 RepID=UPI0002894CE8|nr:beta-agarase [Aquimarina agarilytica]